MSKMNPFKKMLAIILTSFTGMLAITGCSSASKEEQFVTQEAEDIKEMAKNLDNPEKMKKIIKDTKKQLKKLEKEEKKAQERAEKKGGDSTFEETKTIIVGNELDAFKQVYNERSARDLAAKPVSTSGWKKFANGIAELGEGIGSLVGGDNLIEATQSADDFAKSHPEYKAVADAYKELYLKHTGKQYNPQATKDDGKNFTGSQSTNEALDQAADKVNEFGDGAVRKGKEFVDWVKEKAGDVTGEIEQAVEDENARNVEAAERARKADEAAAQQQQAWDTFQQSR